MTTWGMFGFLVFAFIIPPIVLLHRSRLSKRRLCLMGVPLIALGFYSGVTLGPMIFGLMVDGCIDLPDKNWHAPTLLVAFVFAMIVTLTLLLARRARDKSEAERKRKIQQARERILADGVVSGPEGPYVRHKSWDVGYEARTPSETKPPGGHGPYGSPMD
jgi:MFS family permease